MLAHAISIDDLTTSCAVVDALQEYFTRDDIDLRDITEIAKQDPVVLANIMLMVNEVVQKRGSPVVNTLSAAINLVGLEPLKQQLLSIKAFDMPDDRIMCCELIRSRMFVAACLTEYWAEYMGQKSAEEMYCASMFTGLGDYVHCLHQADIKQSEVDIESKESLYTLYVNNPDIIALMPDSIQIIYQNHCVPERLKLSILVYELVSTLEYGYATEPLNNALHQLCDHIGIGIHRGGYDLARQLVALERTADYHVFDHSQFLIATNLDSQIPLLNECGLTAAG